MTLDDLNHIDLKQAGNLPSAVKAVLLATLFLLIVFLGYYLLWSSAWDSLDEAKAKEQQLRTVYTNKKSIAINLARYQQQMADIEISFGAMLKQLPDRSQMDGLLTDINQAGLGRGLEFELFKPGQETQAEFYAQMPISIKVQGTYHELGAFATDISKLSRIVTLNDLVITNPNKAAGKDAKAKSGDVILTMEAVAKTYRYLDADELAAKKKADQASLLEGKR
ncbi:PilO Tfp pilus assembly protein PilO [Methylophilaceae bacterium]|jgi:type IV pilus assembly protein PilO